MLHRTHTSPYGHPGRHRAALELSRNNTGHEGSLVMCASMSEPHLPSTMNEEPLGSSSPFTSIPDGFFRRRTGMTWLAGSRSGGLSSSSSRMAALSALPHEPSFEVEHLGDIKAVDSGWLDDDVEEVMVVSKKGKKGRPLSVVVEATEAVRSPVKLGPMIEEPAVSVDANQFEFMANIRAGVGCESILARKFDGDGVYTVKFVRKTGQDASMHALRLRNERNALKMLTDHRTPYVTRLWWAFQDGKAMYVVTDRTDGRSLQWLVEERGPLSGRRALLCAAEVASALSAMHELNISHANISPECVLIGLEGHVLVSGFETANLPGDRLNPRKTKAEISRLERAVYCAPEMVLGWEIDCAVDWWGFGLVVCWIFTGQHPFVCNGDMGHPSIVRSKLLHGELPVDCSGMDVSAYLLVTRCLQRNPALRIDGLGVKMHDYFQEINWDDVSAKSIEAPFPHADLGDTFNAATDAGELPASLDDAQEHAQAFSFDWQYDLSRDETQAVVRDYMATAPPRARTSSEDDMGDKTFIPPVPFMDVPGPHATGNNSRVGPKRKAVPMADDMELSILPDLVSTPHTGLPTPPNSRAGNLRKYSSLNFDDADEIDSVASSSRSVGRLARSQSAALLRKSKSFLGLSTESLKAEDGDELRPPTPVAPLPPVPPAPIPDLPKGVEHMGGGIGYTYRAQTQQPALSWATLTPRTCHGIFTGRRSKSEGGKRKAEGGPSSQKHGPRGHGQEAAAHEAAGEPENEEDLMDEVMREIYGDEWNAGVSPEQGGRAAAAGLGWEDLLTMSRFGMAADASYAGPDCTLRLVTSPSTPRLDI
ncbi:kinase-like domain-containing protein [Daedaleopsis nitida]|nr:kinase-like domain-containing protein [Daedaleopsis nitida]